MTINMIAAVCENGVIGNWWRLPWDSLSGDMARFRNRITWQAIVMGKNTYESLRSYYPEDQGHPFAGENIVLSTSLEPHQWLIICKDVREVLDKYPNQELLVIGGAETYKAFLPYTDTAELTWLGWEYEWDTHFPISDLLETFQETQRMPWLDSGTEYVTYVRKN